MTVDEAIELVRRKWGSHGMCASCGWHGALYEYEPLANAITIEHDIRQVRMRCVSEYDEAYSHRGVRIPFDDIGEGNHE